MRENYRNSIASIKKFPQFTTMHVIDGQAGLIICASLIFYSLTIDNILNIIVLLILAGVAIATLTGDNGLLTKAGDARNRSIDAEIEEEIGLAWIKVYSDDPRNKYTADQKASALQAELKGSVVTPNGDFLDITYKGKTLSINATSGEIKQPLPVITAGQKAPANSNAQYKSGNYTAIIPAGFTVSATESSIENGLVVTDGSANEWIWIPVSSSDLAKMYTEDTTGWNMLGTSVNTKLKTKELTTQNTFKLGSRELPRTNPGTTADPYYREPDVLSEYDTDQSYRTQAGFGDLADMATKLKNDYKDMIDSVRENGGFYIGRYELGKDSSNNPQVKAGAVMNNANWYNLYSACKSFSSGKVEARMIWGCQWDQVCRFISTLGDNKVSSLDDTTLYGNYSGFTDYETGTRNNCITNNIYDLAGNCWEWTQEAYLTDSRAGRGRQLRQ